MRFCRNFIYSSISSNAKPIYQKHDNPQTSHVSSTSARLLSNASTRGQLRVESKHGDFGGGGDNKIAWCFKTCTDMDEMNTDYRQKAVTELSEWDNTNTLNRGCFPWSLASIHQSLFRILPIWNVSSLNIWDYCWFHRSGWGVGMDEAPFFLFQVSEPSN